MTVSEEMKGVKERPILFSGPMVRALLDGRKTQTRRVIKPQPEYEKGTVAPQALRGEPPKRPAPYFDAYNGGPFWCWWDEYDRQGAGQTCPYGKPGDRLWVREAWAPVPATAYRHSEGVQQVVNPDDMDLAAIFAAGWDRSIPKWKPSIHMPRWACRLVLEITAVRVERLLDCSDSDARAEGLQWVTPGMWSVDRSLPIIGDDARRVYFELWDHINGTGAAEANPWVWAVSFRVLSDEVRQSSRSDGAGG